MVSLGKKIILADIAFSYLLPAILYAWVGSNRETDYIPHDVGAPFWIILGSTVLCFLAFSAAFSLFERPIVRFRPFPRYLTLREPLGMICAGIFVCSLLFYLGGLNHYRYDRVPASERISLFLFIAIYGKSFFSFQALFCLLNGTRYRIFHDYWWYWPLAALAIALTVDGSMTLLVLLMVLSVSLFFPYIEPVFYSIRRPRSQRYLSMAVVMPVVCGLLLFGAWFLGEAVKRNSFEGAQNAFFAQTNHMICWFADRLGSHYYSLSIVASQTFKSSALISQSWDILGNNLHYRFCTLFGNLCSVAPMRPDIVQVSQLNFQNIYWDLSIRAGASPGIITSALYLVPPLFAPVLAGLYYYGISLLIDFGNVFEKEKLSLLGYAAASFLLRLAILDPADMLLIFDSNILDLATFVIVCVLAHERNRSFLEKEPLWKPRFNRVQQIST